MKRKQHALFAMAAIALLALVSACAGYSTATIGFLLTDTPSSLALIKTVNVTVSQIAVNTSAQASDSDASWKTLQLNPTVTVDLLSLQNGVTFALGSLPISGGTQVNQIRLTVDAVSVVETNGSTSAATLPSSGFKIVGSFNVPLSGNIDLTIDFDVGKALVARGANHGYIVKPAIRAIVSNEAGKISGSAGTTAAVLIYAYRSGTYTTSESVTAADGSAFPNAYSSAKVQTDASFTLAFMDAGIYDLYAVDGSGTVVGTKPGISVSAGATASANF